MTVMVTGSEGFIGSHLVEHLLAQGKDVVATYLSGSGLWRLDGVRDAIETVQLDVRDREGVEGVIRDHRPEAIHHLAAQSLPTPEEIEAPFELPPSGDDELPPESAFFTEATLSAFREHPQNFPRQLLRDLQAKLPPTPAWPK